MCTIQPFKYTLRPMKSFPKDIEFLIKGNSIRKQQKLTRLFSQICPVIKMGQSKIILENAHVHPHGINHSLKHHKHHFLEIHIPFSGAGFVETEGLKHPFKGGEFVVSPPEQIHYWEMTKPPLPMLILWIRMEHLVESPSSKDQLLIDLFETKKIVHQLPDDFIFFYQKLLSEVSASRIGMEMAMQNHLSQIILDLARAITSPNRLEQKSNLEPQDRDERITFMVDQFLKSNLASEFRLEDIAQLVSLSARSLTRKYREIKGRSIGEELNRMRMYHAEELLRETDLPIKAIAFECGFLEQRYFARKFKKFYDTNPSDYRNQLDPV